jgi:hypothetical protein
MRVKNNKLHILGLEVKSTINGEQLMVDLAVCIPSPTQPKSRCTYNTYDLAKRILRSKKVEPIRGKWNKDKTRFIVIDGNRRVDACRRYLGLKMIPAFISSENEKIDVAFNNLNYRSAITSSQEMERWIVNQKTELPAHVVKYRDNILRAFGTTSRGKRRAAEILIRFTEWKIAPATADFRANQICRFLKRYKITKDVVLYWLSLDKVNVSQVKRRMELGLITRKALYGAIISSRSLV